MPVVGTASEAELAAYARQRLSPPKRPKTWRFLDELPRTLTGKVLPVRPLGLNVAPGQPVNHVKDFTTWLDAKTLLAVSRPAKKSETLTLNKIVLK